MAKTDDRKATPAATPAGSDGGGGGGDAAPEAAFEVWLRRGLHDMFDDVMQEPVPDELLRLIKEDRERG